jgi:hypothetical protein
MEKDFAEHLAKLRAASAKLETPSREIDQRPDYSQRQVEREGRSPFSGGNFGGGTWAGRSRSEGEQP